MKNRFFPAAVILLTVTFWCSEISAQNNLNKVVAGIPVNYDEALVGTYTLPDLLTMQNGKKVKSANEWYKKRRPEIVKLFEEYQFGKAPGVPKEMTFNVFDKGTPVFDGKAIRRQVTVYFTKDTSKYKMDLLIYLPANAAKPVPLFFNVSFSTNSAITDDPGIKTGFIWGRDGKKVAAPKGAGFGKMNLDQFLSQGIGVATVCYGDIEPDFAKGIAYGIRGHYLKPGTTYPAQNEWGAISAWSWGLSRAMDYFTTDKQIDSKRVALFGVSRLGKTVLWTGAHDQRYALIIASCSGEGGAAISRRNYGETIAHMTDSTRYFYQFCGNWRGFKDDPSKSPVDAHMLVSLVAPRPLLLQTGDTDFWSDPKGEFLAAVASEPVWKLLGKKGLGTDIMPVAGQPILNDLGYYMHSGPHGAMPADYDVFVKFIKMHFFGK
ncbi:MAG: acetylxylan esterase [Bacteroidales bacterium]